MQEFAKIALWWRVILTLAVFLASAPSALSQRGPLGNRNPHVGYVYPAGGQQGTEFEITIGGQFLGGASKAIFSGRGFEATVVKHTKPLSGKQRNEIREIVQAARKQLREARKKEKGKGRGRGENIEAIKKLSLEMGADPEQLEALDKFRRERADPKRQPNPQLVETVVLRVKLAPDAELGEHELRLVTNAGLSKPLRFHVGQFLELFENEPNDKTADAGYAPTLPVVFNGQILPGDVDRFSFRAKKGQHLVVAVKARQLIPYLADAVPGWFQATLTLLDDKGNEVAYVDDYNFHPDPVLYCVIPRRGRYVLQINDAIHRGREDFVYRITLGSFPFVRNIFPLGGRKNVETTVNLLGWNLRSNSLTLPGPFKHAGIYPVALAGDWQTYNRVPFAIDTLPETLEKEPNNEAESAQEINLPLIVNGRIDHPGDWDVFRFPGRPKETLVVEVLARRLNSPLDSVIKLTDAAGKVLIVSDDHEDKGEGLSTHQADSRFQFVLPKQGEYFLHLGDSQHKGGADYGYRLRISGRRPDFALRVVPTTINAPPGASFPITVYALRKDGFTGGISLSLKNAPPGFSLDGAWVPAHQDQVRLTLTVPARPQDEPVKLHLEGHASIGKRKVHRQAIPADDMMQAFIYHHLVPVKDWMVSVKRGRPRPRMSLVEPQPVKLPVGGTARVEMSSSQNLPFDLLRFALSQPPDGIVLESVSPFENGLAIQLRAAVEKAKPGLKGNLLIDVTTVRGVGPKNAKGQRRKQRIPLGTLPAIPFEIVVANN